MRTPHRFELVLSEPLVIGMRRAAQRMVGGALSRLSTTHLSTAEVGESSSLRDSNRENSAQLVLNVLQAELAAMALSDQ